MNVAMRVRGAHARSIVEGLFVARPGGEGTVETRRTEVTLPVGLLEEARGLATDLRRNAHVAVHGLPLSGLPQF